MLSKVKRDSRVDAYISSAPDFAKPILNHLRDLVHTACPDIEETMKWSRPHFLHNGMLCGMSAFKNHCGFGFWMGEMVVGAMDGAASEKDGMGQFGRITSRRDLPGDKELLAFIRKAAALNDSGAKRRVAPRTSEKQKLIIPHYFTAALRKNKSALTAFEAFSPSHKREYVEWITEAKREETREKRIATTLAWLAEGKSRNWKYSQC
jgi:hypothetical protein